MCPSVSRGASHAVDFLLWPRCLPVEHFLHSDGQEVWKKTVVPTRRRRGGQRHGGATHTREWGHIARPGTWHPGT